MTCRESVKTQVRFNFNFHLLNSIYMIKHSNQSSIKKVSVVFLSQKIINMDYQTLDERSKENNKYQFLNYFKNFKM